MDCSRRALTLSVGSRVVPQNVTDALFAGTSRVNFVEVVKRAVLTALHNHPAAKEGGGGTLFSSEAEGLAMTCGANPPLGVFNNAVYTDMIKHIVNGRTEDFKSYPMLARAMTQYLVYRAMQCIASGDCKRAEDDPCGTKLTGEILIDLAGPMKEGGSPADLADFVKCIQGWAEESEGLFKVNESKLSFHGGGGGGDADVSFEIDLSDYLVKYGWIVLHLFMSYVNTRIARSAVDGAQGLTQEKLIQLLGPFASRAMATSSSPVTVPDKGFSYYRTAQAASSQAWKIVNATRYALLGRRRMRGGNSEEENRRRLAKLEENAVNAKSINEAIDAAKHAIAASDNVFNLIMNGDITRSMTDILRSQTDADKYANATYKLCLAALRHAGMKEQEWPLAIRLEEAASGVHAAFQFALTAVAPPLPDDQAYAMLPEQEKSHYRKQALSMSNLIKDRNGNCDGPCLGQFELSAHIFLYMSRALRPQFMHTTTRSDGTNKANAIAVLEGLTPIDDRQIQSISNAPDDTSFVNICVSWETTPDEWKTRSRNAAKMTAWSIQNWHIEKAATLDRRQSTRMELPAKNSRRATMGGGRTAASGRTHRVSGDAKVTRRICKRR
jgi:hypothetical protein